MLKWLKSRLNEKSTQLSILGYIGTLAALPVLDVKTVIINTCAALTGVIAGADTSGGK